jgi:hypothetical protein
MTSLPQQTASLASALFQSAAKSFLSNTAMETRSVEESVKSGIFQNIVTLKMTLKECDLVAVENPLHPDSFAFVARTTAVLVANNVGVEELTDGEVELQVFGH